MPKGVNAPAVAALGKLEEKMKRNQFNALWCMIIAGIQCDIGFHTHVHWVWLSSVFFATLSMIAAIIFMSITKFDD